MRSKNGIDEATLRCAFSTRWKNLPPTALTNRTPQPTAILPMSPPIFKANYPKEWMAALMTCDRDDLDQSGQIHPGRPSRCISRSFLPMSTKRSNEFAALPEGIRFAMTGIKGVGEGVVEAIFEERKRGVSLQASMTFSNGSIEKSGQKSDRAPCRGRAVLILPAGRAMR